MIRVPVEADETADALRKLQIQIFELADTVAAMAKELDETLGDLQQLGRR